MSDLHLSASGAKPMDVFGPEWHGHASRIESSWRRLVAPEDVVLVPGDLSWAMRLEDAGQDLDLIRSLPGRKVILRGNHDYWWKSLSRVRAALGEGCIVLQNDAADMGDLVVAGTRGWNLPGGPFYDEERDRPLCERELERLDMSLNSAAGLASDGKPVVVMMHFPPSEDGRATGFTERISDSGARLCVYGHLHGLGPDFPCDFDLDGVTYLLVSSDRLGFAPLELDRALWAAAPGKSTL